MNKKYLAVLFALVMALSVSAGVFAQDPFAVTWDEETVLTVFNDVGLVFPDMFAPEDSDYLWTEDDTETIPNFGSYAKDVSAEEVETEAKAAIANILSVKATADPCGDGLIKVEVEFNKNTTGSEMAGYGPKNTTYIRNIYVNRNGKNLTIAKCESSGADNCRSVKFNKKGIAKMTLYVYSDEVITTGGGTVSVTLYYSNYMTALFPVTYSSVTGSGALTTDPKKNYCQNSLTEYDPRTSSKGTMSSVRAKYDQNTGEARFQATVANISGGKNEVFKSYFVIPAEVMVMNTGKTTHYKDYTCKYTIFNSFNGAMMTNTCKYGEGIPMYENAIVRFDITIDNLGNDVVLAAKEGDISFKFRVGGMSNLISGTGNGAFKIVDFPCPKETRMAVMDPIKPFMTFYGIDKLLYDNPIKPSGAYGVYEGGVWGLYQKCGTFAYLAVRLRNDGLQDEEVDLNHVAVAINGGTPVNWHWVYSTVDTDDNKIYLEPTDEVILFARVKVTNIPSQLNADVPMTGAVNFMDYGFYITGKVYSDHNNTNCVAAPL